MSVINVTNVVLDNNPAQLDAKFVMHISFECLENLKEDIEWKMIYVGAAETKEFDQVRMWISIQHSRQTGGAYVHTHAASEVPSGRFRRWSDSLPERKYTQRPCP
eukprot:GHVU01054778.1.p3 GENE.GHVU01054778.1~~GHVU01054778.1.p3  ORF type:complete len:105 (+),score=11.51 GHVU01054778.1:480-794(+)